MELLFLALLVLIMATALGSGYPVAFALPGAAIITIGLAAGSGYIFAGSTDAFFHSGGPSHRPARRPTPTERGRRGTAS